MAGAGYKLFNTGDVLTAAQVNTYLQEQAVMVFASAAARTTALSGVLAEGMMSYLQDTNAVEVYDGSAWVSVGSTGDITGVTAGTGISGGGTSGTVTITNSMATTIDAKGDLIVGTGADTFARLAVGTNGHRLVADSGESTGLKWQGFIGCRVHRTTNLSLTNATLTDVPFTSEAFDTNGFHSNTTDTARITIPSGLSGYYYLTANAQFNSSTGGSRLSYFWLNNTTALSYSELPSTNLASIVGHNGIPYYLNAGDYVTLRVYQDSGGAIDLLATNAYTTWFSVYYLGV